MKHDDNMIIRRMPGPTKPVQILAEHIQNPNLSLRARGLYAVLCSMPDDWTVRFADLRNRFQEGRDAIRKTMAELRKNGYIQYSQIRHEDGSWGPISIQFSETGGLSPRKIVTTQKTHRKVTHRRNSNKNNMCHRDTENAFPVDLSPPHPEKKPAPRAIDTNPESIALSQVRGLQLIDHHWKHTPQSQ